MLFENLLLTLPFFALLLILSIFSISLITEKILLFYRWRYHSKNLHKKLSAQLREGEIETLEKSIKNPNCPEAQLIQKSLAFIKHELGTRFPTIPNPKTAFRFAPFSKSGQERAQANYHNENEQTQHDEYRLELWIYNYIEEFSLQMEKHINLFHLIANVATLLGLLGTVTGMIYAFQSGALEQSTQLAQGISQALVTTAGGLVVAIPAIISQQLFQNLIGIRISKLEQLGRDIVFFQHKCASSHKNGTQQLKHLHSQAANEQFSPKEDTYTKNTYNIKKNTNDAAETGPVDLTKIQNRFNNPPQYPHTAPHERSSKNQNPQQSTNYKIMQTKPSTQTPSAPTKQAKQNYQHKDYPRQNPSQQRSPAEDYSSPPPPKSRQGKQEKQNKRDIRHAEA